MIRKSKKIVSIMFVAFLMFVITGCGFSVGNVGSKEGHKDIFTDKTYDGAYKTKNMCYEFTLGENYGKMKIYVDTSEGHSFELIQEPAGFKIKDKDGNDVLYAVCFDKEPYAQYSAACTEVKTINNRQFLYKKNSDGSEDCYTYVADCGLDCGIALEIHDGNFDNFSLVAFRGEALEGASSDVHYYQGESSGMTAADTTGASGGNASSLTSSTLPADVEKALKEIQTDYSKVLWGSRYQLFENMPGVVASVTPCKIYGDDYGLVVAITNLYSEEISFSGSASALGSNDSILGDTFIYNCCIGTGNTIISIIDCGNEEMPDGRIRWEELDLNQAMGKYVPWEADFKGSNDPYGGIQVDYELYTTSGAACSGDLIYALILDEDGFVVGVGSDFVPSIAANDRYKGTISVSGNEELKHAKNVALFINTVEE